MSGVIAKVSLLEASIVDRRRHSRSLAAETTMAQVIDGEAIAADIRREVTAEVAALSSANSIVSLLFPPAVGAFCLLDLASGSDDAEMAGALLVSLTPSLAGAGAGGGDRGELE